METETKTKEEERKKLVIIPANVFKAIFVLGIYCAKGLETDKFGSIIIDLADSVLVEAKAEIDFSNEDIKKALQILQNIDIFPENVIFK